MYTIEAITPQQIQTPTDFNLCNFMYIPVGDIESMPSFKSILKSAENTAANLSQFTLKAGKQWYTMQPLPEKSELTIRLKKGIHQSEIEFILNGDDFDERAPLIRQLTTDRHIIITKTGNNTHRLIGSLQRGADCIYKYTSEKGHLITFQWQSSRPPLYIFP